MNLARVWDDAKTLAESKGLCSSMLGCDVLPAKETQYQTEN